MAIDDIDLPKALKIINYTDIFSNPPKKNDVLNVLKIADMYENSLSSDPGLVNIANARRAYNRAKKIVYSQIKQTLKQMYVELREVNKLIQETKKNIVVVDSKNFGSLKNKLSDYFKRFDDNYSLWNKYVVILNDNNIKKDFDSLEKIISFYHNNFESLKQEKETLRSDSDS